MATATITTKCPEWCESKGKMDSCEDGHDGPSWPSLPENGGFNSLEISVQLPNEGQLEVVVSAGYVATLTPEEALQAGRNLIEAGQWALAHTVVNA